MKTTSCKLKISEGIGRLLVHFAPEHKPMIHSHNYMDLAKPHHSMLGLTNSIVANQVKSKMYRLAPAQTGSRQVQLPHYFGTFSCCVGDTEEKHQISAISNVKAEKEKTLWNITIGLPLLAIIYMVVGLTGFCSTFQNGKQGCSLFRRQGLFSQTTAQESITAMRTANCKIKALLGRTQLFHLQPVTFPGSGGAQRIKLPCLV